MARVVRGSNLFSVDTETIRKVLSEANADLVARQEELIATYEKTPEDLKSDLQLAEAYTLATKLAALAAEARRAKMADGAPFRAATNEVKAFFDGVEAPVSQALAVLQRRLDAAAANTRDGDRAIDNQMTVMAVTSDGEPLIEARIPSLKGEAARELPMTWDVTAVDPWRVDLEQLRPFFTEASLLAACRKHLERFGPNMVDGVFYKERVSISNVKSAARKIAGPRSARGKPDATNNGQPWTRHLDERLASCWANGESCNEISAKFGRTEGSIASRLVRLGICENNLAARLRK